MHRRTLPWLASLALAALFLTGPSGDLRAPVPAPDGDAVPAPLVLPPAPGIASADTSPLAPAPAAAGTLRRPRARILFPGASPRPGSLPEIARALIEEHRAEIGLDRYPGTLEIDREFGSLSGWHLRMVQVVGGVPVYGSEVSAHVAPDGRPLLVNADLFPLRGLAAAPAIGPDEALRVVREALADGEDDPQAVPGTFRHAEPELMALPRGKKGVLAWRIDAATDEQTSRVFVDAVRAVPVRLIDLRRSLDGVGRVFTPNPIHSERNPELEDLGDQDQSVLTAALRLVTLPRLDGSGYLRGSWADLTPTKQALQRQSLDFSDLTRADDGFEQVMAYYHIDRVQQRLQGLGITEVNDEAQDCDAAASSADQSWYDVLDDEINLGLGGVDDGEDGDIVVHEYGHAIQDDQVKFFGNTDEGGAVGEGFCDFLACLFHADGGPYDTLFASWDATSLTSNNPPYLRVVDSGKVFPDHWIGEVHADGEIWSHFLWELRNLLGDDDALRVIVESHFFMTANSGFTDAANGVLLANLAVRDADDDLAIRALLDARGIHATATTVLPPDEDGYEPNNNLVQARGLDPGTYEDLLLADEDWFRLTVPAYRRLHVTAAFDRLAMDLDLDAQLANGIPVAFSHGDGGTEHLDLGAGADPLTVYLRVHDADDGGDPGGYVLTITNTFLLSLEPGAAVLLDEEDGGYSAFYFPVSWEVATKGKKLKVTMKSFRGTGAANDLQLSDPYGTIRHPFGAGRSKTGAKIKQVADQPGNWVLEIRARDEPYYGVSLLKTKPRQ